MLKNDIFLKRAEQIAGVGAWRIDLINMEIQWSDQTCRIHEVPVDYQPTLESAIRFYTPEAQPVITSIVRQGIADGTPWDIELEMITAKGHRIWTRSAGEVEFSDGKAIALAGAIQDITASKLAEKEKVVAAEVMRDFYDHAPCGYYSINAEGIYLHLNQTALDWLGASLEDVIGKKRPPDFFTAKSQMLFASIFPRFLTEGKVKDLEFELVPVNGKRRYVSVSSTANFNADGTFLSSRSVMYDITDLVLFREQATQLSFEQHLMLDNDLIGIIKVRNRLITWANKAMYRIFGYENGEVIGLQTSVFYADDAAYQHIGEHAYPILHAGDTFKTELEMLKKNRKKVWISLNGMLLNQEKDESMWMMADLTESKMNQEQIKYIAYHDALTGLPNRLLLNDRLNQSLANAERADGILAVCYLDLDAFKPVNDLYGHAAGDQLLIEIAHRLLKCVRTNDTVCRLGGDEFVLVLTNLKDRKECNIVLERILAQVRKVVILNDQQQAMVSASIGVSMFPDEGSDKEQLLRQADYAMYQAKESGKNQIVHFKK